MTENFEQFEQDFYEPQLEWYDAKAIRNKRLHRGMKTSQIVLAAFLPVSVSLFPVTADALWGNLIIASSVLLIILESLESYLNYYEKWLNYRTVVEGLRREKQLLDTKTGEYESVSDPEAIFVERVMRLTSKEHRYWEIITQKSQDA